MCGTSTYRIKASINFLEFWILISSVCPHYQSMCCAVLHFYKMTQRSVGLSGILFQVTSSDTCVLYMTHVYSIWRFINLKANVFHIAQSTYTMVEVMIAFPLLFWQYYGFCRILFVFVFWGVGVGVHSMHKAEIYRKAFPTLYRLYSDARYIIFHVEQSSYSTESMVAGPMYWCR